jgi:propane 2-monooxygenase small subunit
MQIAARNGDYITPTIVGTGENDYDRDMTYTRNLFRILTRDEQHGEANAALFGQWLDTWVPRCMEAARALQPLWSQPAEKAVTYAASLSAAEDKFASLLESVGLSYDTSHDKESVK